MHSRCFVLLLCLFVCVFVYLLQLKYFFFVCFCVHLFIYNNFDFYLLSRMAQPLSAISFCYFRVAVLSFFHNYLLFMTLHFCKSTIKIVVCCCVVVCYKSAQNIRNGHAKFRWIRSECWVHYFIVHIYLSGAPNENIVQNHLKTALLNVF